MDLQYLLIRSIGKYFHWSVNSKTLGLVFKFNNLFVLKADVVGGNHIKVQFAPTRDSHSSKPLNAIAFNSVNTVLADVILSRKPYDLSVIGSLKANNWQNRQTVQLQIRDLIII